MKILDFVTIGLAGIFLAIAIYFANYSMFYLKRIIKRNRKKRND